MSEPLRPEGGLDGLLKKYVAVWLWSIIFGATTGASYSYLTIRTDRNWGPLGLLLAILIILGVLSVTVTWVGLLRYLRHCLLPWFLGGEDEDDVEQSYLASTFLLRSVRGIILAVVFRLLIVVAELTFASTGYGRGF